ncbi:hypothetical protein JVU11DRAFT_8644 [Chiua virens]|nr:hypothetical protein JVU11DRAFT_8644 [Chiua virens]
MSSNASSPGSSAQATTSSPASSPTPTSTPSPSTSSPTPTTQATTPASSPAQSTSPAAQTTPSSQAASASASSTSASAATTPASTTSLFTSQVATTLLSTDSGGSIVYVTSTVPEVFSTSVSTTGSSGGGSTSHTSVIVGAVVGGVAGLAILVLLIFCIRRRTRKDDFDGNFDPDRVIGHAEGGTGGTLPNVDLADEVTPFPRPYSDHGSMRQYGDSPYLALPSSVTSGQTSSDFYPPGATSPTLDAQPRQYMKTGFAPPPSAGYVPPDMRGGGPGEWSTRSGGSPPPSTVSYNTSSSARGTKEREAMGRGGQGTGLTLATQPEDAEGSGDVVVHQDAGRAPTGEHVPPPTEIPPAYESIRQD